MVPPKKSRKFSEAEFEKVFHAVEEDIIALNWHDSVFSGVVEYLRRYPSLARNFPSFFGAFFATMRTDLIIRLGRVYDPEGIGKESCTLARCLHLLRDNPQFFTDRAITARLREDYRKANADYLTTNRVDYAQIARDLSRIERSRTRLVKLRHKEYAHKDLETVLSGKRDGFLSSHDEVKELTKLAHETWNSYSRIWNASTRSAKLLNGEDHLLLFENLRRGMKARAFSWQRRSDRFIRNLTRRKMTMQLGRHQPTGPPATQ